MAGSDAPGWRCCWTGTSNCSSCVIGGTSCVSGVTLPALNKLVTQYVNRKDIVFVSLAFDKKEALKEFLSKTTFKYAVLSLLI